MEIMHMIDDGTSVVALGHHDGFDVNPDNIIFDNERNTVSKLSPRKKSEWLASRELLARISKLPARAECAYDDFGKPYLVGANKHISVSHSEKWAAAMVSQHPCGVDIQVYSATILRIAEKFVSGFEFESVPANGNRLRYLHLLWGAKECMYKAYGKKRLEFREHICVTSLNLAGSCARGEIRYEGIHLPYDIRFRMLPEAALVFCSLVDRASIAV